MVPPAIVRPPAGNAPLLLMFSVQGCNVVPPVYVFTPANDERADANFGDTETVAAHARAERHHAVDCQLRTGGERDRALKIEHAIAVTSSSCTLPAMVSGLRIVWAEGPSEKMAAPLLIVTGPVPNARWRYIADRAARDRFRAALCRR